MKGFTVIKTSEILTEVERIQSIMPGVVYTHRARELAGKDYDPIVVGCQYNIFDRPGCIVGLALYNLGVDLETLNLYDQNPEGSSSAIGDIVVDFSDNFEVDDDAAIGALISIQNNQDTGTPWGKC